MGGGAPASCSGAAGAPAAVPRGCWRRTGDAGGWCWSHRRSGEAQHRPRRGVGRRRRGLKMLRAERESVRRILGCLRRAQRCRPPAVVTSGRPGDGETTGRGPRPGTGAPRGPAVHARGASGAGAGGRGRGAAAPRCPAGGDDGAGGPEVGSPVGSAGVGAVGCWSRARRAGRAARCRPGGQGGLGGGRHPGLLGLPPGPGGPLHAVAAVPVEQPAGDVGTRARSSSAAGVAGRRDVAATGVT